MVQRPKIAVVVDSSSCLPQALLDEWQISVVPHELIIDDQPFRDGIDIGPAEFYQILQKNHKIPTTSSPTPARFLEVFRCASAGVEGIVCITLSSNFSATYHSACVAAEMAEDEIAGCPVTVVDSQAAAGAEGLIALEAARLTRAGAGLGQVVSRVEELVPKVSLLAFLDTLYYLRRSGRVPRVAAWAGSILGIKPLTELHLGAARVVDRPRSRARATERMLGVMRDRVGEKPVHVNVMHAHSQADAEQICRRIEVDFSCREAFVSEFTPVMGAHLGPGLLGLAFYTDA